MLYVLIDSRFSWVLQKIGQALVVEYEKLGLEAKLITEVSGECDSSELIVMNYNLYRPSFHKKFSRVGVFLTHAETEVKRLEFRHIYKNANYVICMSASDAYDCLALDPNKPLPSDVFYRNLPSIDTKTALPFVISIFSNCYPDGRKREGMLLDWIDRHKPTNLIIRLIGSGWLNFCKQLEQREVSFQISGLSPNINNEYILQQAFLQGTDVCLYTGNDGGALCVYDALELKVRPLMYRMGYSGDILDARDTFSNEEFDNKITAVYQNYLDYTNRLEANDISSYVVDMKIFLDSLLTKVSKFNNKVHFRSLNLVSTASLSPKNIKSIIRYLRVRIG